MNKIIMSVILLSLSMALIVGAIIPVCTQIKNTGGTAFQSVKNMNTNIKVDP